MPEPWQESQAPLAPRQAVATAIQDLVVARLGRGFIPLAVLFLGGVAELVSQDGVSHGLGLSLGALASAGAMLAYGLRVVQRAFGRDEHIWMSLAMWGSLVPFAFALYVLGWLGLRMLATGGGVMGFVAGIAFAAMGVWVLRCWMRVVEVERLARIMTLDLDEGSSL